MIRPFSRARRSVPRRLSACLAALLAAALLAAAQPASAQLASAQPATAHPASVQPATAGTVAITVDDLPIYPEFPSIARARTITAGLLAGFRRNGWPVIGFVNEGQFEDGHRARKIAVLKQWVDAGADLGNHTYSHPSLTATPAPAFIADIARGDRVTRRLLAARGKTEQWFRYPYLETGATPEARAAVEAWLDRHGYRIAPVSMQNSDWVFAEPYDDAVKHGQAARAAAIRRAYLVYSKAIIAWYRRAAQDVLGREPAFILLLHASALNAVSIDALARILAAAGLRPVPLAQAIADPAYAIPEHYVGRTGLPWVQRWAQALGRPLPLASLPIIPAAIQQQYDRIEAADPDPRAPLPAHR